MKQLSSAINACRSLLEQPARLPAKVLKAINKALILRGLDGNGRFPSPGRALATAGDVLGRALSAKDGIDGVEFAEVISADRVRAGEGRTTVQLALSNRADPFSPHPIGNTLLITWYKHGEGKFEAVAYVS